MKSGILYMAESGRIVGHSSGERIVENLLPSFSLFESDTIFDGNSYFILDGQPTERPASPVTLSDLTLLDVPAGSTLTINGERYDNVEGDVELEFPLPGVYGLRVECFPFLDWTDEVTV